MFDYGPEKRRKPFTLKQKRIEWLLAAGHDPEGKFYTTSKCRNFRKCGNTFRWGDRSYEFDHFNNKPWDNSQKNCRLVCAICHRKATKMKVQIYEHTLTGHRIYKTVKEKAGYKKSKAKPKKKTKARRRERGPFWPWF